MDLMQHSINVHKYSLEIGKQLKLSQEELEKLSVAALYHDVGKVAIPKEILYKKEKLTDEEKNIIQQHTILGAKFLQKKNYDKGIIESVLYHHERYDGTGYPYSLKGEQIPLFSRIISISDSFDAMTSDRVYRKKLPVYKALNEIVQFSGTQFDSKIVREFLRIIDI